MNTPKTSWCFFLVACLSSACGSSQAPSSNLSQSGNGSASSVSNPPTSGGVACGNSNDANALSPTSYQYAFFLREDWTNPIGQSQTDLYVMITNDPNFCVVNPNRQLYDTVTVNSNVPSLSVAYSWRQDPNAGPVVIDANTYQAGVVVNTHPVDTSPYETYDNPNSRICDLYGSGNFNSPTYDTFGANAFGLLGIQSITPSTLTFTLNANIPAYTVPASRGEPAVFSGASVHYALQAKACKFQPEDITKGAPNSPPAVAIASCPN